jgi:hypothetical protein
MSTLKAEYIACPEASREANWLLQLQKDIHGSQKDSPPLPINCDNQAALTLITTGIIKARMNHIDVYYHNSRDQHQRRIVDYSYVLTVWWENGSHHNRATQLSGHVTGLGLSRLCITPSTRLNNLRRTASDTTIQIDRPHQSSSHLFPSSLFCFLVLANQLSRCGSSFVTLLEMKPPFFVAFYGSCSAIS